MIKPKKTKISLSPATRVTRPRREYAIAENYDPLIYPVPLREGVVARLQLPRDLTVEDAEKIVRVVMALGGNYK